MNAVSGYDMKTGSGGGSDPLGTQIGVALSGGAIFNTLASGNTDALDNEVKSLDVCLSHPTKND